MSHPKMANPMDISIERWILGQAAGMEARLRNLLSRVLLLVDEALETTYAPERSDFHWVLTYIQAMPRSTSVGTDIASQKNNSILLMRVCSSILFWIMSSLSYRMLIGPN